MKIKEILKKQGEIYKNLTSNKTIQECNETIEKPKQEYEITEKFEEHTTNTKYALKYENKTILFDAVPGVFVNVWGYEASEPYIEKNGCLAVKAMPLNKKDQEKVRKVLETNMHIKKRESIRFKEPKDLEFIIDWEYGMDDL